MRFGVFIAAFLICTLAQASVPERGDGGANALSIESQGLGRAYSLNFDRLIEPDFAVGAGAGEQARGRFIAPLYMNIYQAIGPLGLRHRALLTAGANVAGFRFGASRSRDFDGGSLNLFPKVGGGYEYRGPVLVRGECYVPMNHVALRIGVSLGYSF